MLPFRKKKQDDEDLIGNNDKGKEGGFLSMVSAVAFALAAAFLIQAFVIKPFRVPSPSMVPTLQIGQRVLVERLSGHVRSPQRGDILVFNPPLGAEADRINQTPSLHNEICKEYEEFCSKEVPKCGTRQAKGAACSVPVKGTLDIYFIKRVVGIEGDRVKIVKGRVFINGKMREEAYIQADEYCPTCNLPKEFTVPENHYFMMGDNRGSSADSREWGPVPEDSIIGKAVFTYWPPQRIGIP